MQGEPNACFKTSANSSPSQLVLPSIKVTGDYPSFRSLHADFFKAFHSMLTPLGSKSFCKRFRLTRLLLLPRTEERCWQQAGVRLHFSNLGVGAKEVWKMVLQDREGRSDTTSRKKYVVKTNWLTVESLPHARHFSKCLHITHLIQRPILWKVANIWNSICQVRKQNISLPNCERNNVHKKRTWIYL